MKRLKPLSSQQLFFLRSSCSPHFFDLSEMKPKKNLRSLSLSRPSPSPLIKLQSPVRKIQQYEEGGSSCQSADGSLPGKGGDDDGEATATTARGGLRQQLATPQPPPPPPASKLTDGLLLIRKPLRSSESGVRVSSPPPVAAAAASSSAKAKTATKRATPLQQHQLPFSASPSDPGAAEPRHPFQERVGAATPRR